MEYTVAVYAIVTVFISGYVLLLSNRRKKLQKEIEYLKQLD